MDHSLGPDRRRDGYARLRDYAAIGDGRTVALVAGDGAIDWLCLPDLDSPSVFATMLDPGNGGTFRLAPAERFRVERRYLPATNVLETTFITAGGVARVTDAMVLPVTGLSPARELARRIEGISGEVHLRWAVEPRFDYGAAPAKIGRRSGVPVATAGASAIAVFAWEAGEPRVSRAAIEGEVVIKAGVRALIALSIAHGDPLVLPTRSDVETRLDGTIDFWRRWSEARSYAGPWRAAVTRSALALKLLIHSPSGAIAAAATTSLPEAIGGERNWDYRYSWIRDSSATLDALLRLGCAAEAEAFFWWLLHASQLTHPRLQVLYRLNGRTRARERELALAGYQGSKPVRIGNAAAPQNQLDVYGHLLHTASIYVGAGGSLPGDVAGRLARTADLVCAIWRSEDSGMWEVRSAPRHFTESKMMCWVALDRAVELASAGHIPSRQVPRWRREAEALREFINDRCWSEALGSFVRSADASEVDAGLLLPILVGYGGARDAARLKATVARVRQNLGRGPLLYRYRGEDGLAGREGAFLACSFWLVESLARLGEVAEAEALMDELVALTNEVGLYAEEVDPATNEFLGNLPQGLVHLGLINAAVTVEEVRA
jgi:GH15 family glucan-1,4-alpha-glucosidase